MHIIGYKVTLLSPYSNWIPTSIDMDPPERAKVVDQLKEKFTLVGLVVVDVKLQFAEGGMDGDDNPHPEHIENIDQLPQYHKPKFKSYEKVD